MIKNANTDLIAGIIGLLVSAAFWFSIDPDISHLSIMFPKAIVKILALTAMGLVLKGLRNGQRSDLFAEGSNVRWIVTGVLFFLWIFAIIHIGFWVGTVLGLSTIVYYLSRARLRPTLTMVAGWVGIVVLEVTFFYLVFTQLLHVPLPKGMLF